MKAKLCVFAVATLVASVSSFGLFTSLVQAGTCTIAHPETFHGGNGENCEILKTGECTDDWYDAGGCYGTPSTKLCDVVDIQRDILDRYCEYVEWGDCLSNSIKTDTQKGVQGGAPVPQCQGE